MKKIKRKVVKEALLLQKYATEEEKIYLNPNDLDPDDIHLRIYGQLTGNCFNERAVQLRRLCGNTGTTKFTAIEKYEALPGANINDLISLIKISVERDHGIDKLNVELVGQNNLSVLWS